MNADMYLKQLTRQIHDPNARIEIMKEYSDHISDQKTAYMEAGMAEQVAEETAVQQMGDPVMVGKELNKIYWKRIDWKTILFFLVVAVVLTLGFPYILPFAAPRFISYNMGLFLLVIGLFWSGMEKYYNFPLFYGARNWNGGGIFNAAFILAVSVAFLSTGILSTVLLIMSLIIIQIIERAVIDMRRCRREEELLWLIGTADTDIYYKGVGTFDGRQLKVESKQMEIKKGTPIIIVSLDGFKPIVAKI